MVRKAYERAFFVDVAVAIFYATSALSYLPFAPVRRHASVSLDLIWQQVPTAVGSQQITLQNLRLTLARALATYP